MVAVVVLSVVALLVHGGIASALLRRTVHPAGDDRTVAAASPSASPSMPSTPTTTAAPTTSVAAPASPSSSHPADASQLSWAPSTGDTGRRLDPGCYAADNPPSPATYPINDPFGDPARVRPGAELLRLYAVDDTTLTPADGAGAVRDCDKQLWSVVATAMPPAIRPFVKELVVYDALIVPGRTNREVATAEPAGTDSSRWRLAIAPNGSSDLRLGASVAREIARLLALTPSQLDGATTQTNCQTAWTNHGCLRPESHLMSFVDQTWTSSEVADYNTAVTKPDDQRGSALQDFYDKHAASFVDPYAGADILDDFAETFGIWCALGPGSPLTTQITGQSPSDGQPKVAWLERSTTIRRVAEAGCTHLRQLAH